MSGFLLGLANGTSCVALCAPILIPFLLSKGENIPRNLLTLLKFLAGRLLGYLLFGLLAWVMGGLFFAVSADQTLLISGTYIGLSIFLLLAVFTPTRLSSEVCNLAETRNRFRHWPVLIPIGIGLLTGLKICPPLLLAFTAAAASGSLGGSLFIFITFFLGTSLYFLPLPLLGVFTRLPDLRLVGKFAAVIIALYYLFSGILMFSGGWQL